jgi:hypothetical protein
MDVYEQLIIHVTNFNITKKISSYILVRRRVTNVKLNVYRTQQNVNVISILSNALLFYMYILYVDIIQKQ